MQVEQLKTLIINSLENSKAKNIEVLDVRKLTDITDYMIVCSGTSNRHTRSIANNLAVESKEHGVIPLAIEGNETGEWVLVDLIDIVVHVMLQEARDFYSLEKLWTVSAEKIPKKRSPKVSSSPKVPKKRVPKVTDSSKTPKKRVLKATDSPKVLKTRSSKVTSSS